MLSRRLPIGGLALEGGGGGAPPPEAGPGLFWGGAEAPPGLAPFVKPTGMSGGGAGILELEGGGGPLPPRWDGWLAGIGGASTPLGGGGGRFPLRPSRGGGGGAWSLAERPFPKEGGGGGSFRLIVFLLSTMSLCAASIPPLRSTMS